MKKKATIVAVTASLCIIGIGQVVKGRENSVASAVPITYGPVMEGFKLSAQPDKQQIQVAEPVILHLRLQNTTAKSLFLDRTGSDIDFQVEVKDARGYDVPTTLYGQGLGTPIIRQRFRAEYSAGKEKTYDLVVNRIVDMSMLGSYTAIVKSRIPNRDGRGYSQVESNPVKIYVTPAPFPQLQDSK